MACFALAHWSGGGAWAWGEVPELLRAAGHEVVAPDFDLTPGRTPMDHAAELVEAVGDPADVIVCGHSYGGLVAPPAAEALGPRAVGVVVLDGMVPDDGDSGFTLRPATADERRAEAERRGDGCFFLRPPTDEFYVPLLRPMPVSSFEAPVRLSGAVDRLPRTFLWCLENDMGEQAERARERGWTVVELAGASHSLPLEDAQRCAGELLRAPTLRP